MRAPTTNPRAPAPVGNGSSALGTRWHARASSEAEAGGRLTSNTKRQSDAFGQPDSAVRIASVLLVWLLFFDFPDGLDRGVGAFLALASAAVAACGAADWRPLKGAPMFPRLP